MRFTELFAIIKKVNPKVKTIIGGVYPSISPDVAKEDENIDYVIVSEGEERLVKLMNAIKINQILDISMVYTTEMKKTFGNIILEKPLEM